MYAMALTTILCISITFILIMQYAKEMVTNQSPMDKNVHEHERIIVP